MITQLEKEEALVPILEKESLSQIKPGFVKTRS